MQRRRPQKPTFVDAVLGKGQYTPVTRMQLDTALAPYARAIQELKSICTDLKTRLGQIPESDDFYELFSRISDVEEWLQQTQIPQATTPGQSLDASYLNMFVEMLSNALRPIHQRLEALENGYPLPQQSIVPEKMQLAEQASQAGVLFSTQTDRQNRQTDSSRQTADRHNAVVIIRQVLIEHPSTSLRQLVDILEANNIVMKKDTVNKIVHDLRAGGYLTGDDLDERWNQ